jgi:Glutamine amidotransferase class-I
VVKFKFAAGRLQVLRTVTLFPDFQNHFSCFVRAMILVLDNYDSFTYNLVQYLGELQADLQVHRNDQITVEQARALKPDRIRFFRV